MSQQNNRGLDTLPPIYIASTFQISQKKTQPPNETNSSLKQRKREMVKITSPESPNRRHSNGGFFLTISAILALLSRKANRLKGKAKSSSTTKPIRDEEWRFDLKTPPKSPMAKPKKLLSNISNKALSQFGKKKQREEREKEGWGNGGVWQKEILMGGKCEPLDFSGVIYYDINGKQTREVPIRSPRASPLPGYLTRR